MNSISIVLPSYNGEKYIANSIDSIINQSFKDWELILVDDHSNDKTLKIMHDYAKQDYRIKVIHNDSNQHLPSALNIGFRNTKYEYLTWTSDDNIYEADALKEMISVLQASDAPMVAAGMLYIDDKENVLKEAPKYNPIHFWYNNNIGACFLYKREILDTIGEYNTDLFGVEDYEYWIRILTRYGKIEYIDKYLYKYRIHENSLSNTRFYDIKCKLNKVRVKNWEYLRKMLWQDAESMALYFDMMLSHQDINVLKKEFDIKEIDFYKEFDMSNNKFLIYGAGEYGKKAKLLLGDVIAFVDSSPQKIGKTYEDKKVISFSTFVKEYSSCQLVVAVDALLLFSIAKSYKEYSHLNFTTFHQAAHKLIFTNDEGKSI